MNILITGSTGLIGTQLKKSLINQGHIVFSLQRQEPSNDNYWNIDKGIICLGNETEIDIVVHLAGESIVDGRWSQDKKKKIEKSRIQSTLLLSDFFSRASYQPKLLISCSAIGFYGNRGDEELTEKSEKGTGFLSDVCLEWEKATASASQAGIRVVNIRLGMVLSSKGGALKKMLLPFKLGLGGVVGSGKQYISWISLPDILGAIDHVITHESLQGPVNFVAPSPVTNHSFTKALGKHLKRPTVMPFPAKLAIMLFGEMAKELLLSSTKVRPEKLLKSGYSFCDATIKSAFNSVLK